MRDDLSGRDCSGLDYSMTNTEDSVHTMPEKSEMNAVLFLTGLVVPSTVIRHENGNFENTLQPEENNFFGKHDVTIIVIFPRPSVSQARI